LKTIRSLPLFLSLAVVFSACSLPGIYRSPTPLSSQNPVVTVVTMTLQVNPSQTQLVTFVPTSTPPTVTASPALRTLVPNAPTWSVYNYTCELATGGATMTMNLAWTDRSSSEESYKVYRDKQVIATLPPNSTSYVDVAFVGTGKTLSYSVEAFNKDWQLNTSTISYSCQ
jgi:hypothetical protein